MHLNQSNRGLLALDIDGTSAKKGQPISEKVRLALKGWVAQGWSLVFVTGRTYHTAVPTLAPVRVPYYLAVQNGAAILEMPSGKLVDKRYLAASRIFPLEALMEKDEMAFAIYSGYEHNDSCYYRDEHFQGDLRDHVMQRVSAYKEKWEMIKSYHELPVEEFASAKCFVEERMAQSLAERMEDELNVHVPVCRDPFGKYFILQMTHEEVNKGKAVRRLCEKRGLKGPIIAAGDDGNDLALFDVADVSVVMETACKEVLEHGDIIAPTVDKDGLIEGLKQAMVRL